MTTPFTGGNRVTQQFAARPDYYRQFGFLGHEGLDLVPKTGDTTIYAVEDGEVVRDIDDPKSGAYGNHVVILNRAARRAWWYCHLAKNLVQPGNRVKRGEAIGTMGATGNTQGAHLHLGLRLADENGNAINTDNGYKGFVDPEKVIEQLNHDEDGQSVTLSAAKFTELVGKATKYDAFAAAGYDNPEKVTSELKSRQEVIDNLNQQINDRNNDIAQLNAQVTALTGQLDAAQQQAASYQELAKQVPGLIAERDQALEDRRGAFQQLEATERELIAERARYQKLVGNAPALFLTYLFDKLGRR